MNNLFLQRHQFLLGGLGVASTGYWPHLFLADRQGIIRYDHIGEGAYAETAQMIQKLLKS